MLLLKSLLSGVVPSILAIAAVATFHTHVDTNIPIGLAFAMGRSYTTSLLLSLLLRSGFAARQQASHGISEQTDAFKMNTLGGRQSCDGAEARNSHVHDARVTEIVLDVSVLAVTAADGSDQLSQIDRLEKDREREKL